MFSSKLAVCFLILYKANGMPKLIDILKTSESFIGFIEVYYK